MSIEPKEKKMRKLVGKLFCKLGWHKVQIPIVADLDTYWMLGGRQCLRCKTFTISFEETQHMVERAYERGKQREKANQFRVFYHASDS